MTLRTVAALCVSGRSIYKHTAGVLAYDQQKDARTFQGGMPVIAHPPCRCWSKYLSHLARPKDPEAEMELGVWCVEQVKKCGGVLEQPAYSRLWKKCNLPVPGDYSDPFCYTVYLEQIWFGYGRRKQTWVLVCGVPVVALAPIPFRLAIPLLRKPHSEEFSRTVKSLSDWLIATARATWHNLPVRHWTAKAPA